MKILLFVGVLASLILAVVPMFVVDPALDENWKSWMSFHGKQYPKNVESWRRMVWEKNFNKIALHNLEHSMGKHLYSMELNQFGDMTNEEFNQLMNGFIPTSPEMKPHNEPMVLETSRVKIPQNVDWRQQGYITGVKNQGHCGSCWAFSATGSLEGQIKRRTGHLTSLSEQNLVDCSRGRGNMGCKGGNMMAAFDYVRDNGGIDSEIFYPYKGMDTEVCKYNLHYRAANCTGFKTIPTGNEAALAVTLATVGPVSVGIDGSHFSFQFYRTGVYHDTRCSTSKLNHAVLVVGYGSSGKGETAQNYWIIKNSWGEHWGQAGYMLMAKDVGNLCGIASDAVYPLM
uniref:Cathepsin L1-like n=1 Tax=Callorhinchus milii TaxID=7868 RepID=A0A4W3KHM5_CALMI|eukprot:gi/632966191/ref/XP_007899281.1/ PREDICTED: cathepsin L1-like [Callorhinchus milii]